jgi:rhodanese-related sulfurtransferase
MTKKLSYVFLLVVAIVLGLAGCASQQAGVAAADSAGTTNLEELGAEVDPSTVAKLNNEGAVAVIDVREDWEYQEGHIEGAALIPLGTLPDRIDDVPTDKPVILVCRSGNRSGQAYRFLTQEGFENVHNMTGGMIAWEEAGLDIAR